MDKPVSATLALQAFALLDRKLTQPMTLIMGGGGAMILAHSYPLATTDIDAIPLNREFHDLDQFVKEIALELDLPGDWLNPYFSTFAHVLPSDYAARLIRVFAGEKLKVDALGSEEMLIMKCFAHRSKDVGHARALLKPEVDLKIVEDRIKTLQERGLKEAKKAFDFWVSLR